MKYERYWHNGAPTQAAITAFTEGDCWILAYRLHQLTGWPVCYVDLGTHWVVKAPDGLYLDVTGVRTRAQLLRDWVATSLRQVPPYTMDAVVEDAPTGGVFHDSYRRALVMARRLLEKHGVKE